MGKSMKEESETENKISVIIPVYNVEKYIRQCLDSIINQSYQNLEILLIDDGSPDNCGTICDEYARLDSRVRVIHKKNAGVGPARNDGIREAAGEWIAFVDPDDWCETDYFRQMAEAIPRNGADILFSKGSIKESVKGSMICPLFAGEYSGKSMEMSFIIKILVPQYGSAGDGRYSPLSAPWNKLYRTSFLRDNGICFNRWLHPMDDVLFNLYVFSRPVKTAACECIGYHYRDSVESSSMHRYNPKWPELCDIFMGEVTQLARNVWKDDLCDKAVYARAIKLLMLNMNCYYFHKDNPKRLREISKDIKAAQEKPYFQKALREKSNEFLTRRQKIFRMLAGTDRILPLVTLYKVKRAVERIKNVKRKIIS